MSLECKRCRTPVFNLSAPCPACGAPAGGQRRGATVTRNRQYVLLVLLSATVALFVSAPRTERQVTSSNTTRAVRIYKGARLYDKLTGRYAGEVVGFDERANEGVTPFRLIALRAPTGQTEWKASETIDRFFETEAKGKGVRENSGTHR